MNRLLSLVLLLLIIGCGGTSPNESTPVAPENVEPSPAWEVLSTGSFHPINSPTTSLLFAKDPIAWNFLHRRVTGMAPDKEINFETDLGVAVLSSKKSSGGYALHITNIEWSGNTATIHIQEISPLPGQLVPKVITSPYTMATHTAPSGWILGQVDNGITTIGLERTYEYLVEEHFSTINDPFSQIAPTSSTHPLSWGKCPVDNTSLTQGALSSTNPGEQTTAHYCPEDGQYWINTESSEIWYGPFRAAN